MLTPMLLLATLPFAQAWSDTGLISRADDWTAVPGVVGYRGDGLTVVPGTDPRSVVADGAATPVDVNANEADPLAVGLAAGVTEFELADPVVALQGSATAPAPHLVLSLDTQGRSGLSVRYRLRDIDPSSIANAVQPMALQFRVGTSGEFAPVPGGFVGDATTGPGAATLVTPVSATLPAVADDKPLVQLRILTTNAVGQDEWVGVDDIEVEANAEVCGRPAPVPPVPMPPGRPPDSGPPAPAPPPAGSPERPRPQPPALTGLTISPATFPAAKNGPAVMRTGRRGGSVAFRLSHPARVNFMVTHPRARTPIVHREIGRFLHGEIDRLFRRQAGRFSIRGGRGANRFRFTGRLRGRPLPAGPYRLRATAIDRRGLASPEASIPFRIRQ
jgi:hypothetical protein